MTYSPQKCEFLDTQYPSLCAPIPAIPFAALWAGDTTELIDSRTTPSSLTHSSGGQACHVKVGLLSHLETLELECQLAEGRNFFSFFFFFSKLHPQFLAQNRDLMSHLSSEWIPKKKLSRIQYNTSPTIFVAI